MELAEIRKHLDRIDSALVMLLAERMSFAPLVAEFKRENNLPVFQPEREREIIEQKRKLALAYGINPEFIERIFKEIIYESSEIQKRYVP